MKLERSFYTREETEQIAEELLGKWLFSSIGGVITAGIICETEAYLGEKDRACHAYGNRRTARTETMFQEGGIAYVYLCYGMHHLLNIVTHRADYPHAVLIRSLIPQVGIQEMERRRKGAKNLAGGPGMVCQALGITRRHDGLSLGGPDLWIEKREKTTVAQITKTPRIGVDYAGEDAHKLLRFLYIA